MTEFSPTNLQILLADDDLEEHYIMALAMKEHASINIDFVNNGSALLSYLDNQMPDILLLDPGMPGLNWQACLRIIRAETRFDQMPVVIYTGSRAPEQIKLARQERSDMYAVKQPTLDKVKLMMNVILKKAWIPLSARMEQDFVVGM